MKKCRRCSKPATLHITEINNGHAVAVHLCETCASEYLDPSNGDSASDDPAADLAAKIEALASGGTGEPSVTCSNCGLTFNEFREQGRLGCPDCYQNFRQDLMPLLENIHEEAMHTGKRPVLRPGRTRDQSRLIHLRAQQREAIKREDYETAAGLRDQIAEIESTLQHGTSEQGADS